MIQTEIIKDNENRIQMKDLRPGQFARRIINNEVVMRTQSSLRFDIVSLSRDDINHMWSSNSENTEEIELLPPGTMIQITIV